jgi:erythromycin esterase-like protein
MSARGELNVGQLMRERYGVQTVLVGFTTYSGTVTAANDWDAPAERKNVRPALPGSYEALFHSASLPSFDMDLRNISAASRQLLDPKLERAIGVIYRPETERLSHYMYAQLSEQFDVVIHFDHTRAVEPLERTARWEHGDLPLTYPVGV